MRRKGFTLLELLVALTILGMLLVLAYGALVQFMQIRSGLDASVSAQAKLRRIIEVLTQDLRSAVLGGLAGYPYPTGQESVSFALIQGGAGYPVLHDGSGDFQSASQVQILSAGTSLDLAPGDLALMVNATGDAVIFKVTSVAGSTVWNVAHAGCNNTIPYTPNTLLFKVQPLGFRYDRPSKQLNARIGDGNEIPVAFDLSGVRIDYIYEAARGDVRVNPSGYNFASPPQNGAPPMQVVVDETTYTLRRLRLVLSAGFVSRGRSIERTYQAQVELSSNTQFGVRQIQPCSP